MSGRLEFSVKLQSFRRLKGWSCAKTAQKVGLTEDQYKHVEEGINEPLGGTWNKILVGLELDPAAFPPDDFKKAAQ